MAIFLTKHLDFFKISKIILVLFNLSAIMFLSYDLRVSTWQKQETMINRKLMFTLESALLFRYARLSVDGEIPLIDKKIEYPSGIKSFQAFSLGGGILLAKAYKVYTYFFDNPVDFEVFHRYVMPAYFVFFSVLSVFCIVLVLSNNVLLGFITSFWYGVYIPSVIRSTGQEFMGENFALPMVFIHAAFFIYSVKMENKLFLWISSVSLAFAWSLWDMTSLYIYILCLFLFIYDSECVLSFPIALCLLIVSCADPYLRAHYAYFSIPVTALFLLCVVKYVLQAIKIDCKKRSVVVRLCVFLFSLLLAVFISGYGEDYGHFFNLFLYKLKFFNVKPLNPLYLPFDVRVLWAPALDSASVQQVLKYFGCILFAGMLPLLVILCFNKKKTLSFCEKYIIFNLCVLFMLYILFVRVHVYVAFFAVFSVLFWNRVSNRYLRVLFFFFLFLLSFGEYNRTLSYQNYMGRGEDYQSIASLVQWIQKYTGKGAPFLSSFDLAGPIVNYADRPVILHPKFEKKSIRDKYSIFLYSLFSEDESDFYKFAHDNKAEYFVYQKGFSWSRSIYSPAYFVALNKAKVNTTLASRFDGSGRRLDKFYMVYENFSYRVFKVVSDEDVVAANVFLNQGEELVNKSQFVEAESFYRKALNVYPGFRKARMRLGAVLWHLGKKGQADLEWGLGDLFKE